MADLESGTVKNPFQETSVLLPPSSRATTAQKAKTTGYGSRKKAPRKVSDCERLCCTRAVCCPLLCLILLGCFLLAAIRPARFSTFSVKNFTYETTFTDSTCAQSLCTSTSSLCSGSLPDFVAEGTTELSVPLNCSTCTTSNSNYGGGGTLCSYNDNSVGNVTVYVRNCDMSLVETFTDGSSSESRLSSSVGKACTGHMSLSTIAGYGGSTSKKTVAFDCSDCVSRTKVGFFKAPKLSEH